LQAELPSGAAGDAEQIVAFLCRKFSSLIDRVQAAESSHSFAQQRVATLEQQFLEAADQRRTRCAHLTSALKVHQVEARQMQIQLQDAQSKFSFVRGEMFRTQDAAKSFMEQCESLSLRCRSDNLNAVDVAGAAAQSDEAWEACERDRVQLRNEHSTLSSRMVACEEELAVGRENERHRRASLRATDDKVATVSRARQAAERRAAGQHDEVCSTVRQVTLFRERLDVARHTLLRREEEFRSDEEKLSTLRTESQRRGHEAAAAAQVYQQLQDSQLALEANSLQQTSIPSRVSTLRIQICIERSSKRNQELCREP
jgi:chromosome segregation ATPase